MFGSLLVYSGLVLAGAGLIKLIRPIRSARIPSRRGALTLAGAGVLMTGTGLLAPPFESRVDRNSSRLDEFAPVWQFHEVHSLKIDAPPSRVFDAIMRVRADEVFLFRTLTWLRRGGRPLPASILNAPADESLIDVALKGGFVRLAEDAPRELVVGTIVIAPAGWRRLLGRVTPETFRQPLPPGFALGTMNFLVTPDGPSRSIVSTETRVFANTGAACRQFARYWRTIYPGSALIRRMWLRAIDRRARGVA
jgi:hypothetical protein